MNISNLSIFGEVSTRNNGSSDYTGFNGGFSSSSISDVWIQNEKVGIWVDGPTTGLTINSVRIQDTTADGINLDGLDGTITNTTVENSFVRNTGDDGIALFSQNDADSNDTITQNTVDSPGLANNIGIYGGGSGDEITNNLLQDTVQYGGGIEISQNYGSIAFSGTLTISGNELVRTGQFDPWLDYGEGAIWFFPSGGDMSSTIDITGNTILDSPYEAFQFENSAKGTGPAALDQPDTGNTVTGVSITNNTVTNVGTFVFQDQAPGSATVSGTTATGVGDAGILTCGSGFTLTQGSGNSGFTTHHVLDAVVDLAVALPRHDHVPERHGRTGHGRPAGGGGQPVQCRHDAGNPDRDQRLHHLARTRPTRAAAAWTPLPVLTRRPSAWSMSPSPPRPPASPPAR